MLFIKGRVTKRHIRRGSSKTDSCPVALSLRQKGFEDVSVDDNTIKFTTKSGHTIETSVPRSIHRFVNAFDDKKKVKPFGYRIEL